MLGLGLVFRSQVNKARTCRKREAQKQIHHPGPWLCREMCWFLQQQGKCREKGTNRQVLKRKQ